MTKCSPRLPGVSAQSQLATLNCSGPGNRTRNRICVHTKAASRSSADGCNNPDVHLVIALRTGPQPRLRPSAAGQCNASSGGLCAST